ncbi:MAG: DNA internalization-related competence protein ComEC/Rec2 [Thermodesulfobacteriota bacterium]
MPILVQRPLGAITLCYLGGLVLGTKLGFPFRPASFSLVLALALVVAVFLTRRPRWCWVYALLLFFALGLAAGSLSSQPVFPKGHIRYLLSSERVNLEGRLVAAPESRGPRTRLIIEAEKLYQPDGFLPVTGKVLLSVKGDAGFLTYGDRVRFRARLFPPENFHNPGAYDYESALARQGIFVSGSVSKIEDLVFIGKGRASLFRRKLEESRERIKEFIAENTDVPARSILTALVLGQKGDIPAQIRRRFAWAGVAHILAISGLHIGIIGGLFFFLFRRLLRFWPAIIQSVGVTLPAALLALIPVGAYSLLAGAAGFSLLRSFIMLVTFSLFLALGRVRDTLDALTLAALLIMVLFPEAPLSISFQLSFAAVLAIIWLGPGWRRAARSLTDETSSPIWRYMRQTWHISLAALAGTAPLVAYHFNLATPVGLVSNLVIVPLVSLVVVPVSLLSMLTMAFPLAVGVKLIQLAAVMVQALIGLVDFFSRLPLGHFMVSTPALWQLSLVFVCLFLLGAVARAKRWARPVFLVALVALAVGLAFQYLGAKGEGKLEVVFLDVKQGDATLVIFPQGATMLVDAGGFSDTSFDVGERVIAPYLLHRGIRKLDYLVITHSDLDHYGGLGYVSKNFSVKEVWGNLSSWEKGRRQALIALLTAQGNRFVSVDDRMGYRFIQGVEVKVLNPPAGMIGEPAAGNHSWRNNQSVVLKLRYGQVSFLLTADIESQSEVRLVNSVPDLSATVIKVPHHGSRTSSTVEFLEAVRPRVAVFSVGSRNRFGLPAAQVLKRYRDKGISIYRVDRQGAISIITGGDGLEVSAFLPKAGEGRNPAPARH